MTLRFCDITLYLHQVNAVYRGFFVTEGFLFNAMAVLQIQLLFCLCAPIRYSCVLGCGTDNVPLHGYPGTNSLPVWVPVAENTWESEC